MKKLLSAALLLIVIAATGCSKNSDTAVIARVNRAKVTVGDFKRQLEDLPPQMQQAVATDPQARKEFLEDIIGIEVVLQEARRLGLDKDAEFKKKQESLRKEMERRIEEDIKNALFNSLLKKALSEKFDKLQMPTDREAKAYYNKHQDKMMTADGKKLSYKEVEPRIKRQIMQEKQRDIYLEYAKGLKAKAKVDIDEKALNAAFTPPAQPSAKKELKMQGPPAQEEGKK